MIARENRRSRSRWKYPPDAVAISNGRRGSDARSLVAKWSEDTSLLMRTRESNENPRSHPWPRWSVLIARAISTASGEGLMTLGKNCASTGFAGIGLGGTRHLEF